MIKVQTGQKGVVEGLNSSAHYRLPCGPTTLFACSPPNDIMGSVAWFLTCQYSDTLHVEQKFKQIIFNENSLKLTLVFGSTVFI